MAKVEWFYDSFGSTDLVGIIITFFDGIRMFMTLRANPLIKVLEPTIDVNLLTKRLLDLQSHVLFDLLYVDLAEGLDLRFYGVK